MKISSFLLALATTLWLSQTSFAQIGGDVQLVPDLDVCFFEGQTATWDLAANDMIPPGGVKLILLSNNYPCFRMDTAGVLEYTPLPTPNSECTCDKSPYHLVYGTSSAAGQMIIAEVKVTIKCPKPNCTLVELEIPISDGAHNPVDPKCIDACENAKATYFLPYDTSKDYTWTATGGTVLAMNGGNEASVMVAWGGQGTGSITVVISSGGTVLQTITFCVNILEGPTAIWTSPDKSICKGQSVSFVNSSLNANSYLWDFGDGSTPAAVKDPPPHTYPNPGTYTVCLIATKDNYDQEGKALCCCSDTMCMDIIVDALPGPNIFCLSTLCAHDESDYWTDATGCSSYVWTVLDENGMPWPFTGQNTPMIHVVWGNGPTGTVTLQVTGCNTPYCANPSSITVPIIPAIAPVSGVTLVCPNDAETYSVQKWASATYVWKIVPASAGVILSGQGTNTVVVQWFASGMLMVNYTSSFLSGLPDQNPLDCQGVGSLNVVVKPRFTIGGPSPVCLYSTTGLSATPTDNYTWSISPAETILTGQGTGNITVKWNTPGPHVVTAVPFNTAAYCNAQATTVVQVIQVPKADSITGPKEVCLNQPYTYIGYTSQSGLTMNWSAVGGTVTPTMGSSVSVTWTSATGPYYIILSLQGTTAPFCVSDTIRCEIKPRRLLPLSPIVGNSACLNAQQMYFSLPVQHPDAMYNWTIAPTNLGSVVSGQGTSSINVQWNNTPGTAVITVTVTLCGTTFTQSKPLTLAPIIPPVITQTGILCPGGSAVLTASGGLPPYTWSTGPVGPSITITSGGVYSVVCTDVNGCTATGTFQAIPVPGPTATITTGNSPNLCILPASPTSITLTAFNGGGYSFAWFVNPPGGPAFSFGPSVTHTNTNVAGTFVYHVVVTNLAGCTASSTPIVVTQDTCDGGGCIAIAHTPPTITNHQNQTPNCATVVFTAVNPDPNVTLTGWNFGDLTTGPGVLNPTHTYTAAGCYHVELYGTVPEAPPGTGVCGVIAVRDNVCVPIVADFTCTSTCLKATFTDGTTFLTGQGPSGPTGYAWNFNGFGTSNLANPMFTFPSSGTYTVTLTVTNAAGCQSTKTKTITVTGAPTPGISITGIPLCAGQPLQFAGSGAGITSWLWNFGTTPPSSNASQNPAQSFPAGTYTVTLTGTTTAGCTASSTQTITVNPVPPPGSITFAPSLSICAGASTTLTAPGVAGNTWLWSPGGATTQMLTVTAAGTYTVVVTNSFLCSMTPAPVTVTVLPAPPAIISGNPIICDNGCVTLSAPQSSPAYTYEWQTGTGGTVAAPNTSFNFQVCVSGLPHPLGTYQVVVTDVNGCSATSPDITVVAATPPNFSISTSPTPPCEGDPVTLTVVPVQPNVVYTWSNGGTGSSIVVTQAGSYQAVGVDTMTGCSFAASAVVHPLPDLCIVPTGCYKVCDPDTICGPDGLAAYQWNLNGVPIPAPNGTNQCLIVTQMGNYSLTGTNSFGCTATSDSLILKVCPCSPVCDSISAYVDAAVDANGNERPCCFNIVIDNMKPNFFTGVNITVLSGGTLPIGNVTAGSGWNVGGFVSGTWVTMKPAPGPYIPIGGGTCAQICLVPTASVQSVLIEFLDGDSTLCDTILMLECENCASIVRDTFICDPATGTYQMSFCVHNANTNTFNANAIVLVPPPGVTVTPSMFSLPNIPPNGTYCTLTATVSAAPGVDLDNLCIKFTIHEQDVTKGLPPKECCTFQQCFNLPDCCPHFATAMPVDTMDGKCCWKITLNQPAGTSLSVMTTIVPATSPVTIDGVLPPIAPWSFTLNPPHSITWQLASGNPLPAVATLPTVCFDVPYGSPVPQLLEIKWSSSTTNVLCRDTLEFFCKPDTDCVAVTPLTLTCVGGQNVYTVVVTNPFNSTLTLVPTHVAVVDVTPASAFVSPGVFAIGLLPPGASTTISIPFNGPAGTKVCFRLNLYRNAVPGIFEDCCVTDSFFCVTLKDCSVIPRPEGIAVYPNPTRGNITLAFSEAGSPALGRVSVRDVTGRLMREEEVPTGSLKHEVLMPGLSSGLYFVEFVEDRTRVWTGKLSVIR